MDYEIIKIRTAISKSGGLSFFEGCHDVPFAIKHMYFIYESNQENRRLLCKRKERQLLLFCPNGAVEIVVKDGMQLKSIALENPSTGLVLWDGIWERVLWKQDGSVLCIAASNDLEEYSTGGEVS